jgi:collagenase-like PrtC family protease
MRHRGLGAKAARAAAIDMLERVRIASPHIRVDDYPHKLSGGMRQRVMIAAIAAVKEDVEIEVWAFGRISLAISARCYHARAHKLTKDSCQFVCSNDIDGWRVETLDERGFLAINGVQTLSHTYCNLIREVAGLASLGIGSFRLSPHSGDMMAVAETFRAVLDGKLGCDAAMAGLEALGLDAPFSNGFVHGHVGAAYARKHA